MNKTARLDFPLTQNYPIHYGLLKVNFFDRLVLFLFGFCFGCFGPAGEV